VTSAPSNEPSKAYLRIKFDYVFSVLVPKSNSIKASSLQNLQNF